MAALFNDRILVSIDIGTTKICVLVAQYLDNDHVEIIGMGKAPCEGLKKGIVVDIAKTVHSIRTAVKEAELMAGITIESASIGVSGSHIHATSSQAMIPIKNGDVRQADIDTILAAARAVPLAEDQHVLHVLPQYFVIDGREKVHNPLGMHGVRLEVQAHIISGALASVHNLIKCTENAGVKVADIILEPIASAAAVLTPDEKELGVAVLDIGGGTSDLAVYQNGSLCHTYVLPVAGNHFTNDLAVGLRTSLKEAERIKKEYGAVLIDAHQADHELQVGLADGVAKRIITLAESTAILHARASELLALVHDEMVKHQLTGFMPAGLVLTGGGSLLGSIEELANQIMHVPVRVGVPRVAYDLPESLIDPRYATGYGMLLYALKKQQVELAGSQNGPLYKRLLSRMKSWVSDFF